MRCFCVRRDRAGGGSTTGYMINIGEVQEVSYEFSAISVESPAGGFRYNIIPKEGGNSFKGLFFTNVANDSMQTDNLTSDLKARGLTAVNHIHRLWDVNPSVGGPIKQDSLWFFGSYRYWGLYDWVAGMYYDKNPNDFVYTPDLSRQALDNIWNTSEGVRLTWQANQKNKFGLYLANQHRCQCHWHVSATRTPEASEYQRNPMSKLAQATWKSPLTNRLLLEAGTVTRCR